MRLYAKTTALCLAIAYFSFAIKKHYLNPVNAGLEDEMFSYAEAGRKMEEYEHLQSDEVKKVDECINRLIGLRAINAKLIPY
jgi:hypothetical protein